MLYSNDYIKLFKLTNKNPVSLMIILDTILNM